MMADKEKYFIPVEGKLIEVEENVYVAYYMLEAFNAELFCELIERITIQNNTKIRFRLKNGLELPESIERTVR